MSRVHAGLKKFECFAIRLDDFFCRKALHALESPVAEERRSVFYELVLFIATVLALFYLIDSAVRRHDPTVRAEAAVISGPMGVDDVHLPPRMTPGIRA